MSSTAVATISVQAHAPNQYNSTIVYWYPKSGSGWTINAVVALSGGTADISFARRMATPYFTVTVIYQDGSSQVAIGSAIP